MKQIHFANINSTQLYLVENYQQLMTEDSDVLISSDFQSNGIGRSDNLWDDSYQSLAFSFLLRPNELPTITPIEIGLLVRDAISTLYGVDLFLKWPNDLLTKDGRKCGGVLCKFESEGVIIVGVGINLHPPNQEIDSSKYITPVGYVMKSELNSKINLKDDCLNIYEYILKNRVGSEEVKKRWQEKCLHMNKSVVMFDKDFSLTGRFIGLGQIGEALLKIDGKVKKIVSGHLNLI